MPYNAFNEIGIFDSEGYYVSGSTPLKSGRLESNRCRTLSENQKNSQVIHNQSTAVYIGVILGGWGHFITDCMRLLWFLTSKGYSENFSECPILYIYENNIRQENPNASWLRLIEILGIDTSLLKQITTPVKYDRIILPDECFFRADDGIMYFSQEYIDTIDKVRDFAAANSRAAAPRKIYYSYSKYSRWRGISKVYGEDKLDKYFASKGYEIIYPEDFSLDEQLNMLINCESFASTVGSCSHNSLFLRDNTEVILIPRKFCLNDYQLVINQVHKQRIHYIDSSFSIFAVTTLAPFLCFISSNLRKYFNDENTESIVCFSDFLKYLCASFGFRFGRKFGAIGEADNPEVYKYYSTAAAEYFGKLTKLSWPYRLRQWLKNLLRRRKHLTP